MNNLSESSTTSLLLNKYSFTFTNITDLKYVLELKTEELIDLTSLLIKKVHKNQSRGNWKQFCIKYIEKFHLMNLENLKTNQEKYNDSISAVISLVKFFALSAYISMYCPEELKTLAIDAHNHMRQLLKRYVDMIK